MSEGGFTILRDEGNDVNLKQRTVLKRCLRTLGAVVVSGLLAFILSPEALDVIGVEQAPLIIALLTPILTAADKALRWQDPDDE